MNTKGAKGGAGRELVRWVMVAYFQILLLSWALPPIPPLRYYYPLHCSRGGSNYLVLSTAGYSRSQWLSSSNSIWTVTALWIHGDHAATINIKDLVDALDVMQPTRGPESIRREEASSGGTMWCINNTNANVSDDEDDPTDWVSSMKDQEGEG